MVDSVDWLEPLVWARVCQDLGWKSIEDAGYGKGYVTALDLWREYIEGLNALRDGRAWRSSRSPTPTSSASTAPRASPTTATSSSCTAKASALLQEHSDIVLFANYRISTVKSDVGFNKKVTRALGSGERLIHTAERPAFLAKNRYAFPTPSPMSWARSPSAMPPGSSPASRRTDHGQAWWNLRCVKTVEPNAPLEALPAGEYRVQILQSEMRVTKAGTGQMLWLDLEVLEGEHKGRHLYDQLNLINPNPTAEEIAQRTLSAICHAVGKLQVSDSEELHFRRCWCGSRSSPTATTRSRATSRSGRSRGSQRADPGGESAHRGPCCAQPRPAPAANASAPWKRSA